MSEPQKTPQKISDPRAPVRRGLLFGLTRVTIETDSPLTIGTGRGDDFSDSICVLDANGLPTIPGSSLAGVLRAAYGQGLKSNEHAAKSLFGFQETWGGASSRVEVSWGVVHNRANNPVDAMLPADQIQKDPVLGFLTAGVVRDHVRIGHRGVADDTGKFDVWLVPAGARFTFELRVHADSADVAQRDLNVLVGLLRSGSLRLGAKSRSGLGAFKVVSAVGRVFDLRLPKDREAYKKGPSKMTSRQTGMEECKGVAPKFDDGRVVIELQLAAEDYWMFGTGRAVRDEHFRAADRGGAGRKPYDRLPVTERRIRWTGDVGTVQADEDAFVLVPASGVKGALRHRAQYHARRRRGDWSLTEVMRARGDDHALWADDVTKGTQKDAWTDRRATKTATESFKSDPDIIGLFGSIKEKDDGGGQPGAVILSDVYVDPARARSQPLQHVSLDRFTQGPMDGLLFSEAPVAGTGLLTLRLQIDTRALTPIACEALADALHDLATGNLALGAGANHGHGYFRAEASLQEINKLRNRGSL